MSEPYFVKASNSETWHIIYPGESRPVCGTRAALDDVYGTFNIPGSGPDNYLCYNCRWSRRLGDDRVHITTYHPKVVCSECGVKVDLSGGWPHSHQKIWQVGTAD